MLSVYEYIARQSAHERSTKYCCILFKITFSVDIKQNIITIHVSKDLQYEITM